MKLLIWAAAVTLAVLYLVCPAFADAASAVATDPTQIVPPNTTTVVAVPYGDWINAASATIEKIAELLVSGLVIWLSARVAPLLPTAIQAGVNSFMINQLNKLIIQYVDAAINATAGAEKGKVLSVDVGNRVLATAVNNLLAEVPGWLVSWFGQSAIINRIAAALHLDSNAILVTSAAGVAVAPANPSVGSGSASPSPSS